MSCADGGQLVRAKHLALTVGVMLFVASTYLPVDAADQSFKYQWNVREILKAGGAEIELFTHKRVLAKTVSASQIRVLYAVKTSIERVAEITTELILTDGDQANAFAGKRQNGANVIGINFAMLDILSVDMHAAAALIGHEIAHLKLSHGEKRAKNQQSTGIMKILGGVALSSLGVPAGDLISDITVTALTTSYSRDNETEADYLGAIWAVEANYEVDGAVRLHEEIYAHSKHKPIPFLSTHPSGPKRIATLKGLSKRLSP